MSHLQTAGSTANSHVQTVIMSFIGTMIAVAVSFAIFSLTQPARAEGTAKTADFDKYASAYMAGLTSNQQQTNGSGNVTGGCEAPETQATATSDSPATYSAAKAELVKSVTNSYNNYMSNTTTLTKSYEKNINSNNTSTTKVDVSDSNGAVVSTNTSTSGDNKNNVEVKNKDSNNNTEVNIDDSFNKDSHDKTVLVNDSFNETNTEIKNDTTIINDSFNKVEIKKDHDYNFPNQHL